MANAANHVEVVHKQEQENVIVQHLLMVVFHAKVYHLILKSVVVILAQSMENMANGQHMVHAANHVEAVHKQEQENVIVQHLLMVVFPAKVHHLSLKSVALILAQLMEDMANGQHMVHAANHVEV